jgi:hypothetical protein
MAKKDKSEINWQAIGVIATVLIAIAGGLWTLYTFFRKVEVTTAVHYKVCKGEYEGSCRPHDAYISCDATVEAWATRTCTKFGVGVLSDVSGNRCGYALYDVTCTVKQ